MTLVVVRHTVRDYAAWRKVYDSVQPLQAAGGVMEQSVYQDPNNANDVLVLHKFANQSKANEFVSSSELRDAMQRAGVEGQPRVEIFEDA